MAFASGHLEHEGDIATVFCEPQLPDLLRLQGRVELVARVVIVRLHRVGVEVHAHGDLPLLLQVPLVGEGALGDLAWT